MAKRPTQDIADEILRYHVEDIQEGFQENYIELSAAPTASEPLLEDNENGTFENIYYKRVANTILVFTPSSTITIT